MNIQLIPMKSGWTCVRLFEEERACRVPIHLCCIIDTSGSMREDSKILYVKQSLQFILDSMGPQDWMSIITFDLEVETLARQVVCEEENKTTLTEKIHWIHAQGGTNLCQGLVESKQCLFPFDTHRKQGIMLLTDGEATHGHVDTSAILSVVNETLELEGTTISCIGYGTNHNVDLLRRLSETHAGSYYVVQRASDIPVVFGDIMGGLLSTCTQRIHIEVDAIEDSSCLQSAYPVVRTGSSRSIDVGDLPAGKEAAVLVHAPPGTGLAITYQPVDGDLLHHSTEIPYAAITTDDEKMLAEVHSLRYEVVALMRSVLEPSMAPAKKAESTDQIQQYMNRIHGLRALFEHPHWALILEELEHLRMYITEPARCCVDFQQVLLQRMGCLAMLRGVGASASNHYHSDLPPGLRITPSLSTAYSNGTQHVYSMNYTQSFQMDDEESPLFPSLPSLSLAPTRSHRRSPIPGDPFANANASASSSRTFLADSFPNINLFDEKEEDDEPQPGM